jgi:transcriptional regulator with XRE-family HTH domain
MQSAFGESLRAWRVARGQSQLALSMRTGVSSRHLSYLARKVLGRIERELGGAHSRDRHDEALFAAVAPSLAELGAAPSPTGELPLLVPVRLRRGDLALSLFTTIATLGTPLDVTLQELRIETLFRS